MTDLDRLREEYRNWWSATEGWTRLEGAQKADALRAALEAENERLRRELVAFMDHAEKYHACGQYDDCEPFWDDDEEKP